MESNQEHIKVAIHCLVYNHEPYLRKCLDGFVMQKTNFRFVAIVHEDASKDGSASILHEYEDKYPEIIHPIYETENQWTKPGSPLSNIMSAAIAETGADYTAICEGDDYWTDPLKLQKQVDILDADDTLMAVFTDSQDVDSDGHILQSQKNNYWDNSDGDTRYNLRDFFRYNLTYPTATVMYRNTHREERDKMFRHTLNPYLGDWTLWIILHTFGDFYYSKGVTAAYRQNPTSLTHTQWAKERIAKVKYEFNLQPRIADILPEEYADIAADLRNTSWVHGALVKAYYKDKAYLKMVGQLFVVAVKFPQYYKELAKRVLDKIKRKLHIK